jgi:acyl-CoA thioesterase-1
MKIRLWFARLQPYGGCGRIGKALAVIMALGSAPALAEPVTVLALGDSLTAGYGLPQDRGLVPQLQAWLEANGIEAVVLNGGVSGDTSAGGLARLGWALGPDVDAVMVTLGGNDLLRGIQPAVTRANLEAILDGIAARDLPVLVVGLRASGNFGGAYKVAFDAIHGEVASEAGALYEPDFFAALGGEGGDPAAARSWMQADGIHPNAEGVARIVARLSPRLAELVALAAQAR